jgi:hypothetical protein
MPTPTGGGQLNQRDLRCMPSANTFRAQLGSSDHAETNPHANRAEPQPRSRLQGKSEWNARKTWRNSRQKSGPHSGTVHTAAQSKQRQQQTVDKPKAVLRFPKRQSDTGLPARHRPGRSANRRSNESNSESPWFPAPSPIRLDWDWMNGWNKPIR